MEATAKKTILRIELWHGLMLLLLLGVLAPKQLVEPGALIFGGVFMGVNFLLLSYGVAWLLAPLASKGKVKAGVGLLAVKMVIFLGLLTTLFFRFELDAFSFALGFSTLLLAIIIEAFRTKVKVES